MGGNETNISTRQTVTCRQMHEHTKHTNGGDDCVSRHQANGIKGLKDSNAYDGALRVGEGRVDAVCVPW